ncbi:hypothetical protein GCM10010220_07720 [Streptomyces parvulus]|nr:hypothetical protein GCM10010220_07720 [Streptomyces parvulus]
MEPLEVGVVERGVLAYEFVHGGHGAERTWRYTRGPRRLGGTLNPPGTAARSNIGRGVCGPGRPKDEEPGQSGQRAPVPRSALLCGEGGGLTVTSREGHGQRLVTILD